MSAKQQQKFFLSECSYKLYYILQFCGFATFTYTSEKGFHMRFYNYLSFIFFTAFYTTLAYLGISRELVIEAKGYQALLFYIGMRFFSYYAILDILFMVISAYLGKRKIFGLFEDYLTMENDLFAHDIETKDEKYLFRYKLIFCLLSVTATLVTTLFFLYVYYFVDGDYIGKIGFNVSMGVQMLNHLATNSFLTQFYVALYMKFEALNEYFSAIFIPSPTIVRPMRSPSMELQETVYRLARYHDKLCVLMSRTNTYGSVFLITGPLNMLLIAVFCFESIFVGLVDQHLKILLMAMSFTVYAFHTYAVKIVLVNSIVLAGQMGRRMGVLIHRALLNTDDADLMLKLELFSMQVLHADPRCSLSVMVVDWHLVFSFLSATLSYSVILVQYQFFLSNAS